MPPTAKSPTVVNQLTNQHKLSLHVKTDFLIDSQHVIEVGGKNKSNRQLKGTSNGYLALDDITVGYKDKIPLYLFGLLY